MQKAGEEIERTACGLSLIHIYMRRGRPSNHIMFGEASALLAGDALLTMAFEIMSGEAVSHTHLDVYKRQAQESVERLAGVELSKMGISSKNIHADMDKQEDGSIGIIRIEIMLASGYEGYGARVESELSEILGVPVEVIAGEKR